MNAKLQISAKKMDTPPKRGVSLECAACTAFKLLREPARKRTRRAKNKMKILTLNEMLNADITAIERRSSDRSFIAGFKIQVVFVKNELNKF